MILKFSDMKNIAIGILSIWLLAACDPVVDNKEMGGIVSESELKLDVHATTDGGNEIIMTNNTPGVGSYGIILQVYLLSRPLRRHYPFWANKLLSSLAFVMEGK